MLQKHKINNSLPYALDFVSDRSLVVELSEANEELLSGGHTAENILCLQLTGKDVEQVTGNGRTVSSYGIRSIPTLMI